MAFPVGPANGALTTINGTVYVYNSTKGAWLKQNVGAVTVTNDLTINGTLTENGNLSVSGSLIPSSSMSLRNFVINGGMDVWQRGTSGFTTHDTYTADRWWFVNDSVGASSVSRVDISSLGIGTQYALRAERTSGTNRWVVGTQLETIDLKRMLGKTITFSCKLRKGSALTSNILVTAGTSSTEARYGTLVDGYLNSTVTNASMNTSTFTTFTYTFAVPSNSAALGYKIELSATQAGATNAYFDVTDVQVEIGTLATPFEHRHYGFELSLCQRYCQVLQNSGNLANGAWGSLYATTAGRVWYKLFTQMRSTPTLTSTSTSFEIVGFGTVTGTVANFYGSPDSVTFDGISLSSTGTVGQPFAYRGSGIISAEL
jgi:hypothetical protein